MATRELEELLSLHFDAALDESSSDALGSQLEEDPTRNTRLAGLAAIEGLLRARAVTDDTRDALAQRVIRSVVGEGSRRRFTREVMGDLPAPQTRRSRPWRRVLAAAAALMLVLGAGWLLTRPGRAGVISSSTAAALRGEPVAYDQELAVPDSESLTVALADGSHLALLPGTTATVPERRNVRLTRGKISLKCRADRSNPFSVLAHGTEARAVGTEYTVEIEEKDKMKPTVIVSILSGLVLVANQWGQLEAGEGKTVISIKGKPPAVVHKRMPPVKAPKPAPRKKGSGLGTVTSLQFTAHSLKECCTYMSTLTKRKIVCDDAISKTKVSLHLSQVPAACMIRWLARLSGAKAYELPDKSVIITPTPPDKGTELLYVPDDSEEWKKTLEKTLKKKISAEFVATPLHECMAFFRAIGKVNIVIDPAVIAKGRTPVSIKVTEMPLGMALNWIVKMAGCEYALLDHAVFVRPAPKRKPAAVKKPPAKSKTKDKGKPEVF